MTDVNADYGIIIVTCDNLKPHAKHSWREGFLKLNKKTCSGYDQEDMDMWNRNVDYLFRPPFSPGVSIVDIDKLSYLPKDSDFEIDKRFEAIPETIYKTARVDGEPEYDFVPHKHFFRVKHYVEPDRYISWDCRCGVGTEKYREQYYMETLGRPWR